VLNVLLIFGGFLLWADAQLDAVLLHTDRAYWASASPSTAGAS
jgi:hypothetical protein